MKLCAAFLIFLLLWVLPVQSFSAADARLVSPETKHIAADQLTWDFGRVRAGDVVKHEFVLINNSSKPLKIVSVTTSCGCTVSKARKDLLAPGESTFLSVAFNSKGYAQEVQQSIYVVTDALDNSVIRYIIKANVEK